MKLPSLRLLQATELHHYASASLSTPASEQPQLPELARARAFACTAQPGEQLCIRYIRYTRCIRCLHCICDRRGALHPRLLVARGGVACGPDARAISWCQLARRRPRVRAQPARPARTHSSHTQSARPARMLAPHTTLSLARDRQHHFGSTMLRDACHYLPLRRLVYPPDQVLRILLPTHLPQHELGSLAALRAPGRSALTTPPLPASPGRLSAQASSYACE